MIKNEVDFDKILPKKYGRHLGHYIDCEDYVFCLNFHQYFEGVISQYLNIHSNYFLIDPQELLNYVISLHFISYIEKDIINQPT